LTTGRETGKDGQDTFQAKVISVKLGVRGWLGAAGATTHVIEVANRTLWKRLTARVVINKKEGKNRFRGSCMISKV